MNTEDGTSVHGAGFATETADCNRYPGELVPHESTLVFPDRFRFKMGATGASAGGVTLAQEGPTRISSATMPAGSLALRLNSTKLAMAAMSLVAKLVRVAAGGLA